MMETEKTSFDKYNRINCYRQKQSMDDKLSESMTRKCMHNSKVSHSHCKGEDSNFTAEKDKSHHLK